MAYTAIREMQKKNQELFGESAGPKQPERHYDSIDYGMKAMALRFLHTRCEGLLFDPEREAEEKEKGILLGTSVSPNQIPYNMQMDINRLCLERELEKFIDSGVAEDAYTIYYCYLEIFLGHYGKSKKMVELLSEFESNGSSLLLKHRDHYSHSVYVFALGLAIYESNNSFRATFKSFYGFDPDEKNREEDRKAACCFLEYWGLTSLFHDIGYPFELPFEQVLSYFEVMGRGRGNSLFLSYRNVDAITAIGDEAKEHFRELYGRGFNSTEELFAFGVADRLGKAYGFTEKYILEKIHNKPITPEGFGYFMDHAYFSATRLYHEIETSLGAKTINQKHLDAFTAILLHNSLFKFAILFFKNKEMYKMPLKAEWHPLACLLMLCDEQQCWDRTAYGRNSRIELHPMSAEFDFRNNKIHAVYYFDKDEQEKVDRFKVAYRKWEDDGEVGRPPRLKAYSDMAEKEQRFVSAIESIVDTSDAPLTVIPSTREPDFESKHTYLSSSNFLHLYDFAVTLNARYSYNGKEKDIEASILEKEFEELSLEYQLSNINQAKMFAKYLDEIDCFYTDRPVNYRMITAFTREQVEQQIAPLEHCRWMREHFDMAWESGDLYETVELPAEMIEMYGKEKTARKALREQMRMHKLVMPGSPKDEEVYEHFWKLPVEERKKDYEPFNSMLNLIKKYDGLRIYSLG